MALSTFTASPIAFADQGRAVVHFPGSVPMAPTFSFRDSANRSFPVRVVEDPTNSHTFYVFLQTDALVSAGFGTFDVSGDEFPWEVLSAPNSVVVMETKVRMAEYVEARL